MTTFFLEPQWERLAPDHPFPTFEHPLLYHQWRTWRALRESHLVVNSYNTGTGKTVAALLRLFDLDGQGKHVLFIAPTNALIAQHAADIRAFVQRHGLRFLVAEISAAQLRELAEGRSGATLTQLVQNPQRFHTLFGLDADDYRHWPLILVVNPDIFYYALYFRYNAKDQRNLFMEMVGFDYVVIDEFHYYNPKQFANFLFFFLLWQQFGAFEAGRRICLLSATPGAMMQGFLDRTFQSDWALIAPHNEPEAEREGLPRVQTLTGLEVTITPGTIQEYITTAANRLQGALATGNHGAIISNALWRINEGYALLAPRLGAAALGRITGPEPASAREAATARPLILATPTVDIGYNFDKLGKPRQNVDFLIADARFADEVVQRLGRAGRVLGKAERDHPSWATVVLPPDIAPAWQPLDGQRLARGDFAAWLAASAALPPKHELTGYIRSHAIMESFYPIYQVRKQLPPALQTEMDALYERLCDTFAPGLKRPAWGPRTFFQRYFRRQQWWQAYRHQTPPPSRETAEMAADWYCWEHPHGARPDPAALQPGLPQLLARRERLRQLRDFVASQLALTESLFAFRDAFQGPRGVVADPQRLLSSEPINEYDLLHLLANYRIELLPDRAAFERAFGATELEGDLYLRLLAFREPRVVIELGLDTELDEAEWQRRFCRCPVALKGLRVRARELGGNPTPLPEPVVTLFEERFIPALVIPPNDEVVMRSRLRDTTLFRHRLTVNFGDERGRDDYHILLGTAAWLAEAELRGHFFWRNRQECPAIIL